MSDDYIEQKVYMEKLELLNDPIDYKELLKKYIAHVLEQNGTDFLSCIEVGRSSDIKDSDYDELCILANEVEPL